MSVAPRFTTLQSRRLLPPGAGPIFANLVLADEINRALFAKGAKRPLSAAMQEKSRSPSGDQTFKLESHSCGSRHAKPHRAGRHLSFAEAQVDRFMLKLKIGYPSRAEERQILDLMAHTANLPNAGQVVTPAQIFEARRVINDIYIDDKVKDYIVDLVCATRGAGKL